MHGKNACKVNNLHLLLILPLLLLLLLLLLLPLLPLLLMLLRLRFLQRPVFRREVTNNGADKLQTQVEQWSCFCKLRTTLLRK